MFTAERVADKSDWITTETGDWEIIIGLEIHAQVASKAKLFSGAATEYGAEPNTQVSLVDAAMPGLLPVLNEYCVEQAVRTGMGMKAQINAFSRFDRKNYFYPDLPQGYQISQLYHPIVGEGEMLVELGDGEAITVGIERLHLEQDAGKSIHDLDPNATYVDLNRCGVALMEIVSKPDMRSAREAAAYVRKLRALVRYLGTCDGDMEKGNLRADVNVSVRRPGGDLGTRCEIKNLNSMRFIQHAIEYEARRQIEILEDGGEIDQETRLYNTDTGETRTMRSKEDAHDYRYFPDPDLLPVKLSKEWLDNVAADLPELPDEKKIRYVKDFGLSDYDASVLVSDREKAAYYEEVADGNDKKLAANWVLNEVFGKLNKENVEINDCPVSSAANKAIVGMISDDVISGKIAKQVFEICWTEGGEPTAIVEERGLKQVTDTGAIEAMIDDIIAANPDQAAKVKDKPKTLGWFVGQVMQASKGKANPQAVNKLLREKLLD